MGRYRSLDDLSVQELEHLLYRKKRKQRIRRLKRLKEEGRVVRAPGLSTLNTGPSSPIKPGAFTGERLRNLAFGFVGGEIESDFTASKDPTTPSPVKWRQLANRSL